MNDQLLELVSDYADPEEHLPVEMLVNPDHPSNEQFYADLAHIKRAVIAAQNKLRPMQRHAVLLHRQGLNNTEVAKKIDTTPVTVGKWLKSKEAVRYQAVMDHHQQMLDGPQFDHRKNILYRIALEQMKSQPKTSISAIQEINKMSGVYAENAAGGFSGDINISINGELMPRGALDVLPETFETRLAQGVFQVEED